MCYDPGVLPQVPRGICAEAATPVLDEPEQVQGVRISHSEARGAWRQGARVLRLPLRPRKIRLNVKTELSRRRHTKQRETGPPGKIPERRQVQHPLHLQGGGQLYRPSRCERDHPNIVPLRCKTPGGPTPWADSSTQKSLLHAFQRFLLHLDLKRYQGGILRNQAPAFSRRPGIQLPNRTERRGPDWEQGEGAEVFRQEGTDGAPRRSYRRRRFEG
mmetsp:Transcript_23965/g.46731  ORF Transcript_23965/g.46731 Transcript_23965/m.46731 type:complete len:216 (-) Transcript_23965:58-705(-)